MPHRISHTSSSARVASVKRTELSLKWRLSGSWGTQDFSTSRGNRSPIVRHFEIFCTLCHKNCVLAKCQVCHQRCYQPSVHQPSFQPIGGGEGISDFGLNMAERRAQFAELPAWVLSSSWLTFKLMQMYASGHRRECLLLFLWQSLFRC